MHIGAVDHDQLVKLAGNAFGSIQDETPDKSVPALLAADPAKYTGSSVSGSATDMALLWCCARH